MIPIFFKKTVCRDKGHVTFSDIIQCKQLPAFSLKNNCVFFFNDSLILVEIYYGDMTLMS